MSPATNHPPGRPPNDRPSRRGAEARWRLRVEHAIEGLGGLAVRSRLDRAAARLARPLRVTPQLRPAEFIVVLSGGIRSTGHLNATTVARVREGVTLFRRGLAPRMIMSGGPRRPGRPSSAPHMRALATALGVPLEHILVEDRSSRTAENAREVARLVPDGTASPILLVSSALHLRRAKLCFERSGMTVFPVPVEPAPDEPVERRSATAQLLHEILGLAYYRLLGWL